MSGLSWRKLGPQIDAMKARVAELEQQLQFKDKQIAALNSELCSVAESRDAACAALLPLAGLDLRPGQFDKMDDSQVVYARDKSQITVGDVRKAREVLQSMTSPPSMLSVRVVPVEEQQYRPADREGWAPSPLPPVHKGVLYTTDIDGNEIREDWKKTT